MLALLVFQSNNSALAENGGGAPVCAPTDDKCMTRLARESVFDPLESSSVNSASVYCAEGGPGLLGLASCADENGKPGFMSHVKDAVRTMLRERNKNAYHGAKLDPAFGIGGQGAVPVCNISNGEGEDIGLDQYDGNGKLVKKSKNHNWMGPKNRFGSCGTICDMSLEVGMTSATFHVGDKGGAACTWEYGQYRGAILQMQAFYRDIVFNQFEKKTVPLVSIDGERPCQELAADIMRLQKAIKKVSNEFVEFHGGDRSAVADLKCPYAGSGDKGSGLEAKGAQDGDRSAPVSSGVCSLTMANLSLRALWSQLLVCEVTWRAGKVFEDNFGSPDNFVKSVKSAMKKSCAESARCRLNGVKQCSGIGCCGDGLRTRLFRNCYMREIPKFLKDRMKAWPGTVDVPTNAPPAPASTDNTKKTSKKSDSEAAMALALGSLAGGARRTGRTAKGRYMQKVIFAFFLVLVAAFGAGCGCEDEELGCKPCEKLENQSKGCVYKACIAALYKCFHNPYGKDMYSSVSCLSPLDLEKDFQVLTTVFNGEGEKVCLKKEHNGLKSKFDDELAMVTGTTAPPPAGTMLGFGGFSGVTYHPNEQELERFKTEHEMKLVSIFEASADCANLVGMGDDDTGVWSALGVDNDNEKFGRNLKFGEGNDEGAKKGALGTGKKAEAIMAVLNRFMKEAGAGGEGTGAKLCNEKNKNCSGAEFAGKTIGSGSTHYYTGDALSDPTCDHPGASPDTNDGTPTSAPTVANSAAQNLADARQVMGGQAVNAEKKAAPQQKNQSGNAATAATKDLSPKAGTPGGSSGPHDSGGTGGHKPEMVGAGGTGGGSGSAAESGSLMPPLLGGGEANAADIGTGDAAIGKNTGFEAASANSGGGSKSGSGNPFGMMGAAGAGGPGANGNVGFGTEGAALAVTEGVINDSKVSLFVIVNKRTEKFNMKTLSK